MKTIINNLQEVLILVKKYFSKLPTFLKMVALGFAIFVVFPKLFIWTIYNTVYATPGQKYFDVTGRQVLVVKSGKLILQNYYLCNSEVYKPFSNSTKNNYGKNMCSEEIVVDEKYSADNGHPLSSTAIDHLPTTAILSGNRVITVNKADPKYYVIEKTEVQRDKQNNYSISKTEVFRREIFDLGTYADNLKKKKPVPTLAQIQNQTGVIWNKPFLVEGEDTIVFYDAMVSKIDHEKPVEAVSRKFTVNVDNRIFDMKERERERLDYDLYNNVFVNEVSIFEDKINMWNIFGKLDSKLKIKIDSLYYPFSSIDYSYGSLSLLINLNTIYFYESGFCNSYWAIFPCNMWQHRTLEVKSLKHDKSYTFRTGTMLYFNTDNFKGQMAPTHGIVSLRGVSQDENHVSIYQKEMFLLDLATRGLVKIGQRDDVLIYIR